MAATSSGIFEYLQCPGQQPAALPSRHRIFLQAALAWFLIATVRGGCKPLFSAATLLHVLLLYRRMEAGDPWRVPAKEARSSTSTSISRKVLRHPGGKRQNVQNPRLQSWRSIPSTRDLRDARAVPGPRRSTTLSE